MAIEGMAMAGRAAIVPKGDFDISAVYKRLDMVLYGGNAYVAKKAATGILPTDTEYWMLSTVGTEVDVATEEKAGIVKPDGDTITVDADGTIHGATKVNIATVDNAGVVKPDGDTIIIEEDGKITALKAGFVGTMEQYEAANTAGEVKEGTIVNITNDYEEGGVKVDGTTIVKNNATKEISVADPIIEKVNSSYVLVQNIKGGTNAIPRGAFLGNSFTTEQAEMIADNNFDSFYIKDYWTIGGVNYRVGHFNYWINTGDTPCATPHILVVPDTGLYTAKMNETDTTEGGYVGSAMYQTGLNQAKTMFANAFGADHILTHRELLVNAVTNGKPIAGAWYNSTVELMNEPMVYGSHFFAPANDGTTIPYLYTIDKTQIALFSLFPELIATRTGNWLRDVVSSDSFAYVHGYGLASFSVSSSQIDVCPAVGIC